MFNRFRQTGFRGWQMAKGMMCLLIVLAAAQSVGSTALSSPNFPPTQRVVLKIEGATESEAETIRASLGLSSQGGWQQRFERVNDALELRVNASNGPLISWPDRGFGGKYTWSYRDPAPEVRDIGQWFGGGASVTLWARIVQLPNGSGSRQCNMDTLYNGSRRQRWEFSGDVQYTVSR